VTSLPESSPPQDPRSLLRASDHDRDRVAETLSTAFAEGRLDPEEYRERLDSVYTAKTLGELEVLTHDLPGHLAAATLAGHPPARPSGGTPVPGPSHTEPPVAAIFGSVERRGRWTVPERLVVTAVFGSVELDLAEAELAAPEVEMVVNAVLGSVQIRVPDHVRVTDAGVAVLGSRDTSIAAQPGGDRAGPLLRLSGVSLLGSVEVRRTGPSPALPG
jgi:Domain of unknown function (DUF1707)/Cell wall-active antibiotics response 4TMS YvqF